LIVSASSLLLCALPAAAQPHAAPLRVFLDCERCDFDYLRTEITFVDYVRDRKQAEVHVLVTTQSTGSGGDEWTLQFIGLERFAGVEHALKFTTPQIATEDDQRRAFARTFKLGLVRYVAETPLADRLAIEFEKPAVTAPAGAVHDPWNYWFFRFELRVFLESEQAEDQSEFGGGFTASRTTDAWRVNLTAEGEYEEEHFTFSDGEEFRSATRDIGASALVVKSLTPKWSAGPARQRRHRHLPEPRSPYARRASGRVRRVPVQRVDAQALDLSLHGRREPPAVRGDDLRQARRDAVGSRARRVGRRAAAVGLARRRRRLFAVSRRSGQVPISLNGTTNVRLLKGFEFFVTGNYDRIRDQVYLPKGEASDEEVLVRRRQLATNYQYFVEFGISYSFGSIFNNIVNPRMSGNSGIAIF
jgi:hypothetical protein